MEERLPATRILHIDRSGCPDGKICPAVVEVDGLVGYRGLVGTVVTDPAVAAALVRTPAPEKLPYSSRTPCTT